MRSIKFKVVQRSAVMSPPRISVVAPKRERIPLALIDRMDECRSLDEENVGRLQTSIANYGLMQLAVVIANGARFLLCIGNHRCEALRRNGETEADCLVLPEGTSPEEALVRSLHENNVRHQESLPDTMRRVTALKEFHGCKSFAEAAALAGISESDVSKMGTVMKAFSPRCLSLVHDHGLGTGVTYAIARHAKDEEEQFLWLSEHVRGERTCAAITKQSKQRDAAIKAATKAAKKPRASTAAPATTLRGARDGIKLRLDVHDSAGIDRLAAVLTQWANQVVEHCRANKPLANLSLS
jgi:hypothetical protein